MVYIALGSNLGEKKKNIDFAVENIADISEEISVSRYYQTEPFGYENQDSFINAVVSVSLDAGKVDNEWQLLDYLQQIETKAGRERDPENRNAPRTLDIDILLYNTEIVETLQLTVPHPRMYDRKFVLLPLLNLNPEISDPKTGIPFIEFYKKLEKQGIYYFSLRSYNF